jgi:tRNA(Ile)-lysidine synthase
MVLLHVLCALRQPLGLRLHAATFDHGLRGAASAADAQFVARVCEMWEVPCTVGSGELDPHAAGVEQRARTARYGFLARVVRQTGAGWLATAHHADDQAETLLMHLLRGAGLRGLRGMRPRAPLPDAPELPLLRPLLGVGRATLTAYAHRHGVPHQHDPTNDDPRFRRNWARHVALPTLRAANPDLTEALIHLAEAAATDDDALTALAQPVIAAARTGAGWVVLPRHVLGAVPLAVRVRAVLWACDRLTVGDSPSFGQVRAAAALPDSPTGATTELAGGVRARLEHDGLVFERAGVVADPLPPAPWLPVEGRIVLELGGWHGLPDGGRARYALGGEGVVRFGVEDGQAVALRTLRAGERVRPLGLRGRSQPLKQWLIDRHIPRRWRPHLPLLTVDDVPVAIWDGRTWVHFFQDAPASHALAIEPPP